MKKIAFTLIILLGVIMLQACSWLHVFVITNNTEETWTITYNLNDHRGIFKDSITIRDKKKEKRVIKGTDGDQISFILQPGQVAEIGFARNSQYKYYSRENSFDQEIPWKSFINMDTLHISNSQKNFSLDPKELSTVLKTNNRGFARLEIDKLLLSN